MIDRAYGAGQLAALNKEPKHSNPYSTGSEAFQSWLIGFDSVEDQDGDAN
jgi:hypothetical protein